MIEDILIKFETCRICKESHMVRLFYSICGASRDETRELNRAPHPRSAECLHTQHSLVSKSCFSSINLQKITTPPKHLVVALFGVQIVAKILFYMWHLSKKELNLSQLRVSSLFRPLFFPLLSFLSLFLLLFLSFRVKCKKISDFYGSTLLSNLPA